MNRKFDGTFKIRGQPDPKKLSYVKYADNYAMNGWFDPEESAGGLQNLRDKGLLLSNQPETMIVVRKTRQDEHRTEDERTWLGFARENRLRCSDPSLLKYMDNLASDVR